MKEKKRIPALILTLAACAGLLAGCAGGKGASTPSDVTETETPSAPVQETPNANGGTAQENGGAQQENAGGSSQDGAEKAEELYVAEVTSVNDDGTLLLTLCHPVDQAAAEITDYAAVSMDKFTLTESTVNYTIPEGAQITRAENGTQKDASAKDIAAGNRLVIYSAKGVSHIVIYPAA